MNKPQEPKSGFNPDDLDEIDSLFFDDEPLEFETTKQQRDIRLVALVSPKGGTGKTSIAMNLAGSLGTKKRKAAVVDLDPRASARRWATTGRGLPFPVFDFDPTQGAAAFRRKLRNLAEGTSIVVIDTPPGNGPPTRLAMLVADMVLIPAGASALDLEATREAIDSAQKARHGRDGDLPLTLIVPSRQVFRTRLARSFAREVKNLKVPVTPAIGQRVEVAAAANAGRLVRPSSTAGEEFQRLSRHIWGQLRKVPA